MELLSKIFRKCHKIVVTPNLEKIYMKKLAELRKRHGKYMISDIAFKVLKGILINYAKVIRVNEPSYTIPEIEELSEDDKVLVKAAISKPSAIIITTDRKDLLSNMKLKKALKNKNIEILSLKEALEYIN